MKFLNLLVTLLLLGSNLFAQSPDKALQQMKVDDTKSGSDPTKWFPYDQNQCVKRCTVSAHANEASRASAEVSISGRAAMGSTDEYGADNALDDARKGSVEVGVGDGREVLG